MGVVRMQRKIMKRFLIGENSPEDDSFYSRKKRALLVEEGALNNEEDGFMQGYEGGFPEENNEDDSWSLDNDIQPGIV